ncbi:MAG: DUF2191 domain-containing protein [Chloroflexota bacterium]
MKVTIAFRDGALYRAVKVRAAASGRQIREVVEEALEAWLERQEDAEDIAMSQSAIAAHERGESVDADEFFRRMVAEGRVDYDANPER